MDNKTFDELIKTGELSLILMDGGADLTPKQMAKVKSVAKDLSDKRLQEMAAELVASPGYQEMMMTPIMSELMKMGSGKSNKKPFVKSNKKNDDNKEQTAKLKEKTVKNKDSNYTTTVPNSENPLKIGDSSSDILGKIYNLMIKKYHYDKEIEKHETETNNKDIKRKIKQNQDLIDLFEVSPVKIKAKVRKGKKTEVEKAKEKPKPTAKEVPKAPTPKISPAVQVAVGAGLVIAGLGSASAKFESGGDPGRVSSGVGDPGGISYGTYQMNTRDGVANAFVKQSDWKEDFKGLSSGTPEFTEKWKSIAKNPKESKKFAEAQHDYIKKTHFDPTAALAKKMGYKIEDPGVADAIWSLSVQHGRREAVLKLSKQNMGGVISDDPKEQVVSLYKARDEYTSGKFSKRYNEEVKTALQKVGNSPNLQTPTVQPSQVPAKQTEIPTKEKKNTSTQKPANVSVLNNNTNIYNAAPTYAAGDDNSSNKPVLVEKQYN